MIDLKNILSITIICVLVGCNQDELNLLESNCIEGTVIGEEKCTGATVIQINNIENVGEQIIYYDRSTFKNVIKVPGQFLRGAIFFKARKYEPEKDEHLFDPIQACPAIYAPFEVPIYVIETHSTANCFFKN